MQPYWEHFPHDADIGIRGVGATREVAFAQAALALTAAIIDPADVADSQMVEVTCDAPDDGLLLVDWLNALIYESATRKMLFSRFNLRIEDSHLHGTAWGETIDLKRHHPASEPKGATYTELAVVRDEATGLWRAQCVIDV